MAEIWEKEYLQIIRDVLAESSNEGTLRALEVVDSGDRPALIMIPAMPASGYEQLEIRFTFEHILENTDQLQILVSMYSGVPADRLAEAEKVIARLNEFMILGNTAIYYEQGMIFFNHAFAFDREMSASTVTLLLGKTMEIIMNSIPQIMEVLHGIVNGSASADELIAQGIDLIQ